MNIFATFECPLISARYLDDKRVVKMVLESAQLLSNAIILNDNPSVYKLTHQKHPCTLWVHDSRGNYEWLLEHFESLALEYKFRYGKIHKCVEHFDFFNKSKKILKKQVITKFPNCAKNANYNIDYSHLDDVHLAYRLYLNERWKLDKRQVRCSVYGKFYHTIN